MTRRWTVHRVTTILLLAAAGAAVAVIVAGGCRQASDSEAVALLAQAQQARATLSLRGQVVTRLLVRERMVQAEADVARGEGRVILKYKTGPKAGMRIIKQGGQVWVVSKERARCVHRGLVEHPLPNPQVLQKNFVVTKSSDGLVAGRPTTVVVVRPRSGLGRRGKRRDGHIAVWLDNETHFPLAIQRFSGERLVSETYYTSVQFNVPPPPRWQPPAGEQRGPRAGQQPSLDFQKADEHTASRILGTDVRRPAYVPAGFTEGGIWAVTIQHRGRRARPLKAIQIRYSDGLRFVTIIERSRRPEALAEHPRPGTAAERDDGEARIVHLRGRCVARRVVDGIVVNVAGQLPDVELLKIARSIQ